MVTRAWGVGVITERSKKDTGMSIFELFGDTGLLRHDKESFTAHDVMRDPSEPQAESLLCTWPVQQQPVFQLSIEGIPEEGTRTRVETLIKFVLKLRNIADIAADDGKWEPRSLVAPPHQMAKRERFQDDIIDLKDSLELRASLFCSEDGSTPDSGPLKACRSCIHREERKDQQRKRTRLERKGLEEPNDEDLGESLNDSQLEERIIVFSGTSNVFRFVNSEVLLPARITCYCRHHGERVGFRVCFEIWDSRLEYCLASAFSPPIMVTDDHKKITSSISSSSGSTTSLRLSPPPSPFPMYAPPVFQMERPRVAKAVPGEGPIHGGTEIILLGHNLTFDCQFFFASNLATILTLTNPQTAMVRLPPSQCAGIVPVTVISSAFPSPVEIPTAFFLYKNNLEAEMMELALQLIGMKLTGKIEDAKEVAIRIIQENQEHNQHGGQTSQAQDLPLSGLDRNFLEALIFAEFFSGKPFKVNDFLDVRTKDGQTLAHLGGLSGACPKLFEFLCGFGTSLMESPDSAGLTPVDLAYLSGTLDAILFDYDLEEKEFSFAKAGRYNEILRSLQRRKALAHLGVTGKLQFVLDALLARLRRPRRIRGQLKRLGYTFSNRFLQTKMTLPRNDIINTSTNRVLDKMSESIGERRLIELILWYSWIPIFLAVALVWWFSPVSEQVPLASHNRIY